MSQRVMSRELTMEIAVGWFMVMILLGLSYFTIILSRETWFGKKHKLQVEFRDVMGLREGDSAVVHGMPVGKVKRLTLSDGGVLVDLSLDRELAIRDGYRISVVPTSILGGRALSIDDGLTRSLAVRAPPRPLVPAGTVLTGTEPHDLIADASDVINALKKGLVEGGTIDNFRKSVANLQAVTERISSGKGSLGRLLSEDDTLYRDLSATVGSLRAVSERLEKGEGTLGRLMAKDDKVYEDLSATVTSLKTVAARLEKGEGALGRLLKDDSLYKDIETTVKEVQATVDDFREATPVTTFTSIFFGGF